MKINVKGRIILPLGQCKAAGIEKGEEVEIFADRSGDMSIVKKEYLEEQRLRSLNKLSTLDQELDGMGYD